jgi:hypothetical protein
MTGRSRDRSVAEFQPVRAMPEGFLRFRVEQHERYAIGRHGRVAAGRVELRRHRSRRAGAGRNRVRVDDLLEKGLIGDQAGRRVAFAAAQVVAERHLSAVESVAEARPVRLDHASRQGLPGSLERGWSG